MRTRVAKLCAVLCTSVLLASCGSSGSGEFKTVRAAVGSVSAVNVESDVAKHSVTDPNLFFSSSDSVSIPPADEVSVVLNSSIYNGISAAIASSIIVHSATITFSPISSTVGSAPAIPAQFQAMTVPISAGGTATIPVRVVTQEIKQALLNSIASSGAIYGYYTTIAFDVEEVTTGTHSVVKADLNVRISDFIDK